MKAIFLYLSAAGWYYFCWLFDVFDIIIIVNERDFTQITYFFFQMSVGYK
jgi:hypothetical protein